MDAEMKARELLDAIFAAPFGTTTVGDMICAEATSTRLRAAMMPVVIRTLEQPASAAGVSWVRMEGNAEVGPIRVHLELADGRSVEIIRDSGTVIDHSVSWHHILDLIAAAPKQGEGA